MKMKNVHIKDPDKLCMTKLNSSRLNVKTEKRKTEANSETKEIIRNCQVRSAIGSL